jgi:hypothetical protein
MADRGNMVLFTIYDEYIKYKIISRNASAARIEHEISVELTVLFWKVYYVQN